MSCKSRTASYLAMRHIWQDTSTTSNLQGNDVRGIAINLLYLVSEHYHFSGIEVIEYLEN